MNLRFTKIETLGNHFALVEEADVNGTELAGLAVTLCRSRFGIGADGLLVVGKTPDGISLRMFNADGSEDFCGNGLRCAASWAYHRGLTGKQTTIAHRGRLVRAQIEPGSSVTIELPAVDFEPSRVPVLAAAAFEPIVLHGSTGYALSSGSTHFVVPMGSEPSESLFETVSPLIEHDPAFPERTSVMWVCAESPDRLSMRIWERGVGETFGCGTGAIAAAVVHSRLNGVTGAIQVTSKGGTASVVVEHWSKPVLSSSLPHESYSGIMKLPCPETVASQQASLH